MLFVLPCSVHDSSIPDNNYNYSLYYMHVAAIEFELSICWETKHQNLINLMLEWEQGLILQDTLTKKIIKE